MSGFSFGDVHIAEKIGEIGFQIIIGSRLGDILLERHIRNFQIIGKSDGPLRNIDGLKLGNLRNGRASRRLRQ